MFQVPVCAFTAAVQAVVSVKKVQVNVIYNTPTLQTWCACIVFIDRNNLEWRKFRRVMCHLFAGVAEAGNRVCVC